MTGKEKFLEYLDSLDEVTLVKVWRNGCSCCAVGIHDKHCDYGLNYSCDMCILSYLKSEVNE